MRKEFLCLGLTAIALCLSSCDSTSKETGSLEICIDGNGLSEYSLEPILSEFQSQYPGIELEVKYLPVSNHQDTSMMEEREAALTRTRTELMSGEGADMYLFFNAPAATNYENYMLFPDLERQIRGGVFHDLDFLFEHEKFKEEEYVGALTNTGVYEEKSYILPLSYTVSGLTGVEETLAESGFNEDAAAVDMSSYMEEVLALDDTQRPYLSSVSHFLLLHAPSVPPVSVDESKIQLELPVWQEVLEINRQIVARYGYSEEDFMQGQEFAQSVENGAVLLPAMSDSRSQPYNLRLIEEQGYVARLLPIPNEEGGLTMMPDITAAVSAGCEDTDAAASLLLFLLGEQVQGSEQLEESGTNAGLFAMGMGWPVRKGCGVKMMEQIAIMPVEPGTVSDTLKADVEAMENRIDTCRLAGTYDAQLHNLIIPYIEGTQSWEECYANIEKEWSYLDE